MQALATLARAITLPRQRFSLIVVRSNSSDLRHQVLDLIRREYSIAIETLVLERFVSNLYTEIQSYSLAERPSNLVVLGFENVEHLDDLLASANRMRDGFRQQFTFPVVLWVDDDVANKLIKLAPDFYSWAGTPICFDDSSSGELKN